MLQAAMTPTQAAAHQRAVQFRQKIAARAVKDEPIDLKAKKNGVGKKRVKHIPIRDLSVDNSHLYRAIKSLETQLFEANQEIEKRDRLEAETRRSIPPYAQVIHGILKFVAKEERVSIRDITSSRRMDYMILPRQIFCYLAETLTDKSHSEIAKVLNRDRTTVLHSIRRITGLIPHRKDLADRLVWYEAQLKAQGIVKEVWSWADCAR